MVEISRGQVKPMRWRVDPSTVLLVLWGMFIIYGTLIPFAFTNDVGQVVAKLHLVGDTLNRPSSRSDVVSNVLLFLPWGGLFAFRRARRGAGFWPALLGATFSGMALERPGGDLPTLRPQPHSLAGQPGHEHGRSRPRRPGGLDL